MTNQLRYSYTTSWAVGRRFRSERRIAPTSRRCAGANLAISVRNSASAARRSTADWVLPGTSTSTWTERRPDGSFFTLIMAPWESVQLSADQRLVRRRIPRDKRKATRRIREREPGSEHATTGMHPPDYAVTRSCPAP